MISECCGWTEVWIFGHWFNWETCLFLFQNFINAGPSHPGEFICLLKIHTGVCWRSRICLLTYWRVRLFSFPHELSATSVKIEVSCFSLFPPLIQFPLPLVCVRLERELLKPVGDALCRVSLHVELIAGTAQSRYSFFFFLLCILWFIFSV